MATTRKTAPAVDLYTLDRALKSAKGVLWTLNKKEAPADRIAEQEAKVADLQAQWDAVRPAPARGYDGPAWVVLLDEANGKVTSTRAANGAATRTIKANGDAAGLTFVGLVKIQGS